MPMAKKRDWSDHQPKTYGKPFTLWLNEELRDKLTRVAKDITQSGFRVSGSDILRWYIEDLRREDVIRMAKRRLTSG
jgi:hypothetical protein